MGCEQPLVGFPPVIGTTMTTLILGSFPSPASLAAGEYYAHRQNQFWKIMACVLDEPLMQMTYAAKCEALLRHQTGLWDIFKCCTREGALDSSIRNAELNDFTCLKTLAPQLSLICFNGKTSAKLARYFASLGYRTEILPSSSPAYTLSLPEKVTRWLCAGIG